MYSLMNLDELSAIVGDGRCSARGGSWKLDLVLDLDSVRAPQARIKKKNLADVIVAEFIGISAMPHPQMQSLC
jgi:hypothetical protein